MKNLFIAALLLLSTQAFAASFCVGDSVVANFIDGHYNVRIVELYSDHTAKIRFNSNQTQVVPIDILTMPIRHEGGFSVGDSVVANFIDGHYDVRILELYSDGTAKIRFNSNQTQVVPIAILAKPITCEGGCSGDDDSND